MIIVKLSLKFVKSLDRSLSGSEELDDPSASLSDNFRPTQPLNNRNIFRSGFFYAHRKMDLNNLYVVTILFIPFTA